MIDPNFVINNAVVRPGDMVNHVSKQATGVANGAVQSGVRSAEHYARQKAQQSPGIVRDTDLYVGYEKSIKKAAFAAQCTGAVVESIAVAAACRKVANQTRQTSERDLESIRSLKWRDEKGNEKQSNKSYKIRNSDNNNYAEYIQSGHEAQWINRKGKVETYHGGYDRKATAQSVAAIDQAVKIHLGDQKHHDSKVKDAFRKKNKDTDGILAQLNKNAWCHTQTHQLEKFLEWRQTASQKSWYDNSHSPLTAYEYNTKTKLFEVIRYDDEKHTQGRKVVHTLNKEDSKLMKKMPKVQGLSANGQQHVFDDNQLNALIDRNKMAGAQNSDHKARSVLRRRGRRLLRKSVNVVMKGDMGQGYRVATSVVAPAVMVTRMGYNTIWKHCLAKKWGVVKDKIAAKAIEKTYGAVNKVATKRALKTTNEKTLTRLSKTLDKTSLAMADPSKKLAELRTWNPIKKQTDKIKKTTKTAAKNVWSKTAGKWINKLMKRPGMKAFKAKLMKAAKKASESLIGRIFSKIFKFLGKMLKGLGNLFAKLGTVFAGVGIALFFLIIAYIGILSGIEIASSSTGHLEAAKNFVVGDDPSVAGIIEDIKFYSFVDGAKTELAIGGAEATYVATNWIDTATGALASVGNTIAELFNSEWEDKFTGTQVGIDDMIVDLSSSKGPVTYTVEGGDVYKYDIPTSYSSFCGHSFVTVEDNYREIASMMTKLYTYKEGILCAANHTKYEVFWSELVAYLYFASHNVSYSEGRKDGTTYTIDAWSGSTLKEEKYEKRTLNVNIEILRGNDFYDKTHEGALKYYNFMHNTFPWSKGDPEETASRLDEKELRGWYDTAMNKNEMWDVDSEYAYKGLSTVYYRVVMPSVFGDETAHLRTHRDKIYDWHSCSPGNVSWVGGDSFYYNDSLFYGYDGWAYPTLYHVSDSSSYMSGYGCYPIYNAAYDQTITPEPTPEVEIVVDGEEEEEEAPTATPAPTPVPKKKKTPGHGAVAVEMQ